MAEQRINVERLPLRLRPDPRRVITRFFGGEEEATKRRLQRVLAFTEGETEVLVSRLLEKYGADDPTKLSETWLAHFHRVESFLPPGTGTPTHTRRLLIGAYFTMHYALEAAALFNPSIVPQVGQVGPEPGLTPFVLSLRAVGEGHLSSIVFRTGTISADNSIRVDEPAPEYRVLNAEPEATFSTEDLRQMLTDLGHYGPLAEKLLAQEGERINVAGLLAKLERLPSGAPAPPELAHAKEGLLSIVGSNYRVRLPGGVSLQEAVLFPASANETSGIEDLRLVLFTEDDGSQRYYGTYTAYNGLSMYPTLLQASPPDTVESRTLVGQMARNKGMALFPRKIGGRYVMSGRVDGENLYILESSSVRVWNEGKVSMQPKYWWESSGIGNCGSPIETEHGWILLTHGIGPMRQYCVGAALLDLDDPARVIGRLHEPLLSPTDDERIGYVPNVVYTCGSMVHNGDLIIPYAMSDMVTTFARVDLDELLQALRASPE